VSERPLIAALNAAAGAALVIAASPCARANDLPAPHMPVIETPATGAGDAFVVLYSGDGGWNAAARGFAADLAAAGDPVAGVDSLRYFLRRRTPARAAADLAALIERDAARWSRPRVILVGYSFGADNLPLIVEALPPEARARVALVALISPADRADMAFRILSWFDMTLPGARPLAPALATLPPIPALCIEAEHDPRAACDRFPANVRPLRLPGDHRYGGEYDAVARAILDAAQPATARRLEAEPNAQENQ